MKGWKECKLGEVIYSNGSSITASYSHKTIKYLDTGSITCGKIDSFQEILLSEAPSRAKRLVKDGSIVYSTVRPIQRHYGYIKNPPENLVVSTGFSVIETQPDLADSLFIYHLLASKDVVELLDTIAEGSTSAYPSLKPTDIENLDILLPPLPEQKAIAAVLSSLDDKIDLLHRQNKTLEAMAETLFRQWFVEEADEGWEEGKILDYCLHHKDGVKPQNQPNEIFSHYSIPAFDNSLNPVIECGSEIQSNKYSVVQNSFLFSKLNPNKVKRIWLILDDLNENAICSTEFQVVRPKDKKYLFFTYLWLSIPQNYDEIASGVGGTSGSHQRIDPADIFNFACPLIGDDLLISLNSKVAPIFMKVMENRVQIRTLEKLRDTLLPKLMSGEVRVKV